MPDRSKVEARRSVVPGSPGWGLTTNPGKMYYENSRACGGQWRIHTHSVAAPVRGKNIIYSNELEILPSAC
jgi:hypothetical protein